MPSVALARTERERLVELEAVVDAGLQTFVDVGNALMEIREARLYRETHSTFKSYCQERFGFSDSRGRQLIAAAKTVTDVTALGLPAPKTEGEARRLARAQREGITDATVAPAAAPPSAAALKTAIAVQAWASVYEQLRGLQALGAHTALGYESWEDYLDQEFGRDGALRETVDAVLSR